MRILLSLAFIALLHLNLFSRSDTTKFATTVTKFGDYLISNHEYVHGTILRVSGKKDIPGSDSLITLFNSKGKLLFTDTITLDGSGDISISADTMNFCGVGTLLAYSVDNYASYGNCTNSLQFWGFNKSGEFVPFTGFISVCSGTKPMIRWVNSRLKLNTTGNELDCPDEKERLLPYVAVQHETKFCDVTIIDYYKIDLNGLKNTRDYAPEKVERQPILADNSQFKTLEYEEELISTLRLDLYSKPHLSALKRSVSFKKSNRMKFQYCTQTPSNFWICARINGVDGFMLLEDLEKLGFEVCD
jgi:hypothetical protein